MCYTNHELLQTKPSGVGGGVTRHLAVRLAGSALFALLFGFGNEAERLMREDALGESNLSRALRLSALFFVLAFCALTALRAAGRHRKRARRLTQSPADRPWKTRRAFGLILLCYVPMFVLAFPGSFAYDVPFQLKQTFTGAYSTHHPLLHTLLLGACVSLGRALGSVNLGAALYTALQCVGLAACFSLCCAGIARRCGARAARWATAFFALYPLHMVFAVNATKDVLFSGLLALTLSLAAEAFSLGLTRRRFTGLCVSATLMLLLRNNAVYAMAVWALLLPLLLGRRGLRPALCAALCVAAALAAGGVLSLALHAQKGDLREMLSWPIQQLARARVTCSERLSEEERAAVDALMPGEAWRLYDPAISDPVKFEFDTKTLLRDPAGYVRAYLSIGKKCPHAYFDALLLHTYPFFYPYRTYRVPGRYVQMSVSTEYYGDWWQGERIKSAFPRLLSALQWRFGAQGGMQIPIVGNLFNTGLIVWVMLTLTLRALCDAPRTVFPVALFPILLWGTFLMGPVMAGRYIYPFVCVLPILAARERS